MDQCRRLQGLPGVLLGHLLRGELSQLALDQWQEMLGCVRVALLDRGEDLGDVAHLRIWRKRW